MTARRTGGRMLGGSAIVGPAVAIALFAAGSATVPARAAVIPQPLTVTVHGSGAVTGQGIYCQQVCSQDYPRQSAAVVGFGHSGEEGYGATDPTTQGWMGLLSGDLGALQENYGVGGAVAAFPDGEERPGGWTLLLQNYIPGGDLAAAPLRDTLTLWFGLNDVSALNGSANLGPFAQAMTTMISRLDSVALREAGDPSVSAPAGWTYTSGTNDNSGDGVLVPSEPGAPLTIKVPAAFQGGTIALGFTATTGSAHPSGDAAYAVRVDGRPATTYTIDGSTVTPSVDGNGGAIGTVDRLTGLAAGAHTITIALASTSGTISTAFNYWQAEAPLALARPIVVPLQYYPMPTGYSAYAPYGYVPDDQDVTTLNEIIERVAQQFPPNVQTVPLNLGDDPDNFYYDGLHPSNAGYELIAAQALSALRIVVLSATPGPTAKFLGWSGGGCSGTATCTVSLAAAQNVSASFSTPDPPPTTVAAQLLSYRCRPDGTLLLELRAPGQGRLSISAQYARGSRRYGFDALHRAVKRATNVKVVLKPGARARRLLRQGRRLRVIVSIGYTPEGATRRNERSVWVTDALGRTTTH